MPAVARTLKKQCPNCGTINEFAVTIDDAVTEPGSARVTCSSCSWKFKITSPGLQP